MDLTKSYPRSARDQWHGIVQLGRTTDKAKAKIAGTIGEYHYNCPMDQAVFSFLGIDADKYLDVVKNAKSDDAIGTYAAEFIHKKSPQEIETWNTAWLKHAPEPGTESETYLRQLVKDADPSRTDITAWIDALDLDEKRPVPKRVAA